MKRYLYKTDLVKQLLKEKESMRECYERGHRISMHNIAGINSALRIVEQMETITIIHCRDCVHWHTGASSCPMCHDEWFDDDGWSDFYTVDNTPDDGSGFCYMGKKYKE